MLSFSKKKECLTMLKDTTEYTVSGKIIHVPQGRSGRLVRLSSEVGIKGLYTYGISCCNILLVIGQDKISLMHLDTQTHQDTLKAEFDWVNEPDEIILMFREEFKPVVTDLLIYRLNQMQLGKSLVLKPLNDGMDGIFVHLDTKT